GKNSGNSEPDYWFNTSSSPPMNAWNFNGLWKTSPADYPTHNSPAVYETAPILVTTDTTPNYTFASGVAGAITYGGSCSSATATAVAGSNTVTFSTLSVGAYTDCTISVGGTTLNVSGFDVISGFAGGAGSSGDPYQISTCAQLQYMRSSLGSYYVLNGDIDCDVAPYNTGAGFEPVGTSSTRFTGGFNGGDFTIDGLFIFRPLTNYVGLFGYVDGTDVQSIHNVALSNANITGYSYTGPLVGYDIDTAITDVSVIETSSVSGQNQCGGLVGGVDSTTVSRSSSSSSVSGYDSPGGLIGVLTSAYVYNSYATGAVSGSSTTNFDSPGGLVGVMNSAYVYNSYATGAVSAPITDYAYVGGLVGYMSYSEIDYSYATGAITGPAGRKGGLFGNRNGGTGVTVGSYWDVYTSGQTGCYYGGASAGCTGVNSGNSTPTYFLANSTNPPFDSWDFVTPVWYTTIDSYPVLIQPNPIVQFTVISSSGAESVSSVNVEISMDSLAAVDVTVDYEVTGGTATGGGTDYTLASGIANVTAGSLTTNISLAVVGDGVVEGDETVIITISNPVNGILGGDSQFTYTIENDDTLPSISLLSPLDDASGVLADSTLSVTFDRTIVAGTGHITVYDSGDTPFESFDVTTDISGSGTDTVTFTPSSVLVPTAGYYVLIDATAFDDIYGNGFVGIADSGTWNFTVEDKRDQTVAFAALDAATFNDAPFALTATASSGLTVTYASSDETVATVAGSTVTVVGAGTTTVTASQSGNVLYNAAP
ncbi:hypothetical protein COY93_00310, partial [Candidatus Uhrbacteria bacterium CG_4_10_14_0_8_um_filter_58_22]